VSGHSVFRAGGESERLHEIDYELDEIACQPVDAWLTDKAAGNIDIWRFSA
jgi:hypothetical protein